MDDKERDKHSRAIELFRAELDGYAYGSQEYLDCVGFIREHLEALVGQTWTTRELQQEFKIDSFAFCLAFGTRKSDGAKVSIDFMHHPRFYHSVRES